MSQTKSSDKRRKPYANQGLSTKIQPYRDRRNFEQTREAACKRGWETRRKCEAK